MRSVSILLSLSGTEIVFATASGWGVALGEGLGLIREGGGGNIVKNSPMLLPPPLSLPLPLLLLCVIVGLNLNNNNKNTNHKRDRGVECRGGAGSSKAFCRGITTN